MRAAALALALVALGASGCYGMCGPQVNSVEAGGVLPAAFSAQNQTAARAALEGAGFTIVEETSGWLRALRDEQSLHLQRYYLDSNQTEFALTFQVDAREFRSEQDALAYIADEVARLQPEADATHALLLDALGLPDEAPPPALDGTYAIC